MRHVTLLDQRTSALALIQADEPGWEAVRDRVTDQLAELGAEAYLVEGPEQISGDDRLWVGVYANGHGVFARWAGFVAARRKSYRNALAAFPEVQGLVAEFDVVDLRAELESTRARLLLSADEELRTALDALERQRRLTEEEWVLYVPEEFERDVLWLWATLARLDSPG